MSDCKKRILLVNRLLLMVWNVMEKCTICASDATTFRFEVAQDKNGNECEILQCSHCFALINSRAHRILATGDIQEVQRTDFYISNQLTKLQAQAEQFSKSKILDFLFSKLDLPYHDLTFCDFGGGSGLVALAAAERFKHSYVCEFDTRSAEQMCSILGKPKNFDIVQSLNAVNHSIDVMFMWHVLEHIPNPLNFLIDGGVHFSKQCVFFVQCPCYRPDAIVDCHYTFFNEPSIRTLFDKAGVKEIEVGFDTFNGFVSYLGVKV